jgi:hypothetical protein
MVFTVLGAVAVTFPIQRNPLKLRLPETAASLPESQKGEFHRNWNSRILPAFDVTISSLSTI